MYGFRCHETRLHDTLSQSTDIKYNELKLLKKKLRKSRIHNYVFVKHRSEKKEQERYKDI